MNLKKLKNKLFRRPGQRAVIAVPYIWLLILFLIPFAIVLKISFAEQEIAIPPFTPLTTIDEDLGRLNIAISYQNYADIFQNFWNTLNPFGDSENSNIYLMTYWSSIKTALTTTIICLLIGYRPLMPFHALIRLRATVCCWQSCCLSGPLSCCVFTHGWAYWVTTASSTIS